jgi:hypothetical protein
MNGKPEVTQKMEVCPISRKARRKFKDRERVGAENVNWLEYRYLRATFDLPIESKSNVVPAPSND